jgi:DNA adenine methylase
LKKDLTSDQTKVIQLFMDDQIKGKGFFFKDTLKQFNNLSQTNKNTPMGTSYFIFLNKTCFRGIYREGPNGFNVPFGNYKNPEIINEEHLKRVSILIRDVNFYCLRFENSFEKINKKDFVYLDPPYAPENKSSFVGYTKEGFNIDQHINLFKIIHKITDENKKMMLSNADVSLVRDNFGEKYKI